MQYQDKEMLLIHVEGVLNESHCFDTPWTALQSLSKLGQTTFDLISVIFAHF